MDKTLESLFNKTVEILRVKGNSDEVRVMGVESCWMDADESLGPQGQQAFCVGLEPFVVVD